MEDYRSKQAVPDTQPEAGQSFVRDGVQGFTEHDRHGCPVYPSGDVPSDYEAYSKKRAQRENFHEHAGESGGSTFNFGQ